MPAQATTHGPSAHSYTASPPSNPKPKSLLPTEILLAILYKLAQPDLAVCARTSRFFYNTATPILYKSLYIDLGEDLNPLFNRPSPEGKRSRPSGPRLAAMVAKMKLAKTKEAEAKEAEKKAKKEQKGKKQGWFSRTKVEPKPMIQPPQPALPITLGIAVGPLPSRFSFTAHLTITSHSRTICDTLPPLDMPLEELRLRPGVGQYHLDFCQCTHFTEKNGRCTRTPTCLCPLIAGLRPRRLIVGDDTTGLTGSALGMTTSNFPYPPEWISELVVFVGSCTGLEIGPEAERTWLDKMPSTVERLTLVLQPREGIWAQDGRWRFRRVAGFEGYFDAALLWNKLAMALSGSAGVLEVVGVETIDRDWTELPIKLEEAEIRKALKVKLVENGWKESDALGRVAEIRFMERKEFDKRRWGVAGTEGSGIGGP